MSKTKTAIEKLIPPIPALTKRRGARKEVYHMTTTKTQSTTPIFHIPFLIPKKQPHVKKYHYLLLMGLMYLSGCSGRQWTETSYTAPNWTPSGKVIAFKMVREYRENLLTWGDQRTEKTGGGAYIVTMDADGNNETTLFSVDYGAEIIQVSPSETYIAFSSSGKIYIYSFSGQLQYTIDISDTIYSFDWSPDETKVAVQAGLEPIKIYAYSGTLLYTGSYGSYVSWKYAEKFVFRIEENNLNNLAFTSLNDTNNEIIDSVTSFFYPQYLKDGNKVYYFNNQSLFNYTLSNKTSEIIINFDTQNFSQLNISPDGLKIVAEPISGGGIWIIDTQNNTTQNLR